MKVEKLFLVEMEVDDTIDEEEKKYVLDQIYLNDWEIEEMIQECFERREVSDLVNVDVHDAFVKDGKLTYYTCTLVG